MIRAAKYLGVPPWELVQQPVIWRKWAEEAEHAEGKAEQQLYEKNKPMDMKG